MSELNPAQAAAADLTTSALVSAGAGSGKTRVLTRRWINALPAHGFRPERLLAITFTEKAAGEMRQRLRTQLDALAQGRPDEPGWRRAREALWRAQVGTIHGLCASLLREFPLEAGVDPDFGILEETDRHLLADEIAAETVNLAVEADDPDLGVAWRSCWPTESDRRPGRHGPATPRPRPCSRTGGGSPRVPASPPKGGSSSSPRRRSPSKRSGAGTR